MKRILSLALTLAMLLSLSVTASAIPDSYMGGSVDTVEYIGDLTVTHFNDVWGASSPTSNTIRIITPGTSITGLYYEKLYAKYNEDGGYYEVVEKVANHRAYTQSVQAGYIGVMFNYAPLATAGSSIAKENWKVWQHIRVGDRLYLNNIDLELKNLKTSGTWGTSTYSSDSYIEVETVDPVYPTVTPYSNKSIVAQGDSITVGGGWTSVWSDYLSTTVINAGFGGDTSWASLSSRYNDFVAVHDPEIVIVSFGINDAFSAAPSDALMEKYKQALRDIHDKNTELGAKTIFMNANVIKISAIQDGGAFDKGDYSAYGGEEAYLDGFIDCMRQVAEEKGSPLIDLYSMWKAEGLSPDNIIDSCHPNGNGYDRNWEVQRPALINNMKFLCGDEIRVLEGTTAKHAIDGMPDCTVTVTDAEGSPVEADAVLLDGYKVSYTYGEGAIDAGTYTVKTLAPAKAYVSKDAPFSVRGETLYYTDDITVNDIENNIFNTRVEVADAEGNLLEGDTVVTAGCSVYVDIDTAVLTVADGNVEEDIGGDEPVVDPYEGCELGENLLAGKPYLSTYNAFQGSFTDENNELLTDGALRGKGDTPWNGDNGFPAVTVEYAGTYAVTAIDFTFDQPTDIHMVTFKNVRIAANRGFKLESIGVSTDGETFVNVPVTVNMTVVEGAPGYGSTGLDQYYDISARADILGATAIKLSFGTDGAYIVQLDEIEAAAYIV